MLKKSLIHFLILASLGAMQLHADQRQSVDENAGAETLFHWYMSIKPVRDVFRYGQWAILNTPQDKAFTDFFYYMNEIIPGIFDKFKEEHDRDLDDFVSRASIRMTQLIHSDNIPEMTDAERRTRQRPDEVIEAIENLAKGMGAAAEAIKNAKIFSYGSPEKNAYTVSGNNNRLIMVFHTELYTMNPKGVILFDTRLAPIVLHELGHINALHSVKMRMHNLLLSLIQKQYIEVDDRNHISSMQSLFRLKCNFGNSPEHHGCHMKKADESADEEKENGDNLSAMAFAFAQLIKQKPQVRQSLIKKYLTLLIQTAVAEDVPYETIAYFADLIPGPRVAQYSAKEFLSHVKIIVEALSRSQEKSADGYPSAYLPKENVFAAMHDLAGHIPQADSPAEARDRLGGEMATVRHQYNQALKALGQDISNYVDGTHPPMILRLGRILNTPDYPGHLFADPFLRLLLLEDMLATEGVKEPDLAKHREKLQQDLVTYMGSVDFGEKINADFDKLIQYYTTEKRIVLQTLKVTTGERSPDLTRKENKAIDELILKLKEELATPRRILLAVEKRLREDLAKSKSSSAKEKARKIKLTERLNMIQLLIKARSVAKLKELHDQAFASSLQSENAEKKSGIPPGMVTPPNPEINSMCLRILSAFAVPKNANASR